MFRSDSPCRPDDFLLFTPVATAYRGANGWSAEVQRPFLSALARTGVVVAAARSVGCNPRSAYRVRARAGENSPVARAWNEAQRLGSEEARHGSMAGGMAQRRTEVFHRGRHIGRRTAYVDRLAYTALRALDRQDARRAAESLDATKLLAVATELRNGRESREAKPDGAASGRGTPLAAPRRS